MIRKINFGRSYSFPVAYEGEPTPEEKAAADKAAADKAEAERKAKEAEEVKTQEQLNKVLKREKEKFRQEREKMVADLEALKSKVGSEADREQLEKQIEELRIANMTVEEQARRNKEKLENEHKTKLTAVEQQMEAWKARHNNLLVGHTIVYASTENEVLPNSIPFVDSFLRPKVRLVEEIGDDGRPSGVLTPKVKMPSQDKDGKPIELDLTVIEAVKFMKDNPDSYGMLFKGNNAGGLGGSTGQPGKRPDVKKLASNPEEYMRLRKENPALLGLK